MLSLHEPLSEITLYSHVKHLLLIRCQFSILYCCLDILEGIKSLGEGIDIRLRAKEEGVVC